MTSQRRWRVLYQVIYTSNLFHIRLSVPFSESACYNNTKIDGNWLSCIRSVYWTSIVRSSANLNINAAQFGPYITSITALSPTKWAWRSTSNALPDTMSFRKLSSLFCDRFNLETNIAARKTYGSINRAVQSTKNTDRQTSDTFTVPKHNSKMPCFLLFYRVTLLSSQQLIMASCIEFTSI